MGGRGGEGGGGGGMLGGRLGPGVSISPSRGIRLFISASASSIVGCIPTNHLSSGVAEAGEAGVAEVEAEAEHGQASLALGFGFRFLR